MLKPLVIVFLLAASVIARQTAQRHRDYVPDRRTAERIAEAVLVAQYGEERVKAQLPLHAVDLTKEWWTVQGYIQKDGIPEKGGGLAVWVNKHSGCIGKIVEHLK